MKEWEMSDSRLERLEEKVDVVRDEVNELKTDFKVHQTNMDNRMDLFQDHIAGDNKIITHIQPILERLPEIIETLEDHKAEKIIKKDKELRLKKLATVLGIIGTICGIVFGAAKVFL